MLFKRFPRKKKTINKPSFPLEVTKCFLFLAILSLVIICIFQAPLFSFIEQPETDAFELIRANENEYKTYISTGDEVILNNALETSYVQLLNNGITLYYELDGRVLVDTTSSYNIRCWAQDNTRYGYYGKWDPSFNDKYMKIYEYVSQNSEVQVYIISPRDFYVGEETGAVYPGVVDINSLTVFDGLLHNNPDDYMKTVDTIDLTPDSSVTSGTTHIVNDGKFLCYMSIGTPSEYVLPDRYSNSWSTDEAHGTYRYAGEETHHYNSFYNMQQWATNSTNFRLWLVFWVIVITVIVLSFIIGTIRYFSKKSYFEIFEYRRKTTEAMAHDLKTPLAAISLSATNLKENLGVNPSKCEFHATNIEDTVEYANNLIDNILQLSKSEVSRKKLNITPLDMRGEITDQVKSLEASLSNRNMEVEIIGDGIVRADKELWNQAVINLLTNSIKYGSKESKIRITIENSEDKGKLALTKILTISNTVDEDIKDCSHLMEAFVKGSASRGENSGSGLGLAIANNNLSTLGIKLNVECKDKTFVATISR